MRRQQKQLKISVPGMNVRFINDGLLKHSDPSLDVYHVKWLRQAFGYMLFILTSRSRRPYEEQTCFFVFGVLAMKAAGRRLSPNASKFERTFAITLRFNVPTDVLNNSVANSPDSEVFCFFSWHGFHIWACCLFHEPAKTMMTCISDTMYQGLTNPNLAMNCGAWTVPSAFLQPHPPHPGDFSHLWVATRRTLDTASVWMSSDSGSQWKLGDWIRSTWRCRINMHPVYPYVLTRPKAWQTPQFAWQISDGVGSTVHDSSAFLYSDNALTFCFGDLNLIQFGQDILDHIWLTPNLWSDDLVQSISVLQVPFSFFVDHFWYNCWISKSQKWLKNAQDNQKKLADPQNKSGAPKKKRGPRTERLVSSSHAAAQLGIAGSADGRVLAMVFEELGASSGRKKRGSAWADSINMCTTVYMTV